MKSVIGLLIGVPWGVLLCLASGVRGTLAVFVVGVSVCLIARGFVECVWPNATGHGRSEATYPEPAASPADVVREFEDRITPHILRHWDRERIVAFAKHLLGDACQVCPSPPGCSAGGAS